MEKILVFLLVFLCSSTLYGKFAVKSYYELRNKTVIRQTYEESCGAASLATLINMLDSKNISEIDILEQMSKNKKLYTNMVNFFELKEVLEKLKYESRGYKLSRKSFEKLNIPLIVKIENDPKFPHFVVAINHEGDFITIFDPSFGKYLSTKKEFYSVWDKFKKGGFALIVAPIRRAMKQYEPSLPCKLFFEK